MDSRRSREERGDARADFLAGEIGVPQNTPPGSPLLFYSITISSAKIQAGPPAPLCQSGHLRKLFVLTFTYRAFRGSTAVAEFLDDDARGPDVGPREDEPRRFEGPAVRGHGEFDRVGKPDPGVRVLEEADRDRSDLCGAAEVHDRFHLLALETQPIAVIVGRAAQAVDEGGGAPDRIFRARVRSEPDGPAESRVELHPFRQEALHLGLVVVRGGPDLVQMDGPDGLRVLDERREPQDHLRIYAERRAVAFEDGERRGGIPLGDLENGEIERQAGEGDAVAIFGKRGDGLPGAGEELFDISRGALA